MEDITKVIEKNYAIKKELDKKQEELQKESINLKTSILEIEKKEIELQLIEIEINKRVKSNGGKQRAEEEESQFGKFERKSTHLDPSFVS